MRSIDIRCPSCRKSGVIEIAEERIKNVARGLLAINIARDIVCEHSFIAYIDRNFAIRDYFVADFHINIPNIAAIERIKENKIPTREILDIDLIKLNLTALTLSIIIKSIFSRYKIVLITNQEFLHKHISNFLSYITKDAFDINFSIITSDEYQNNKKNYKDAIVLENNNIIQNPKKIINLKKLAVEKNIVNQFLTEPELGYSYIMLKNQIYKAYEISKNILKYAENQENQKDINTFKIEKYLEDLYQIKIDIHYLDFLVKIIYDHYGIEIPSASESFLGGL